MNYTELQSIIDENRRRNDANVDHYDPLRGDPSDPFRQPCSVPWHEGEVWLPSDMIADPKFDLLNSELAYQNMRIHYDFEYWAATCVTIRHKISGQMVHFHLNKPQRRVLRLMERDRHTDRPIRLIMLKARQWGGSTLIQMYFAWIQSEHRTNWHSLISAHVKDSAANIRGMYSSMLATYPEELWKGDAPPKLNAWQGAVNTREIAGRGCRITLASCGGQDSARGLDISMAHLSEVAFWTQSARRDPVDFVRSVIGGVPMTPCSVVVMESTANGVGNFFHNQWLMASENRSAFRPVFVPWYEIDMYRSECTSPQALIESFSHYEKQLWDMGLTLEQIWWYRNKLGELASEEAMQAEYPTTALEAFANTGTAVFPAAEVEQLAKSCIDPIASDLLPDTPKVNMIKSTPSPDGTLQIWKAPPETPPMQTDRYIVTVDIGGRSRTSDYSVVAVMDRFGGTDGKTPEVVAQWRGHADHDLLGRYAADMGRAYGNALLVVESNSLESASSGASQFILEDLNRTYSNMYVRTHLDLANTFLSDSHVGFHTNRSTKAAIITELIKRVRNGSYLERDIDACNEMITYEQRPNGSYSAKRGHHDDILITRAIALYIISTMQEPDTAIPKAKTSFNGW